MNAETYAELSAAELRVVVGALAQGIDIRAGEAGVEPAGRHAFCALEVLTKLAAVDTQVGLQDVVDRQTRVLVQFFCDRRPVRRAEVGSRGEGTGIVTHGELFDLGEQSLEGAVLTGQLLVIPGGRSVRGQHGLVGKVDAGVARGAIGAQVEVENLRQQDHAVEIDRAVGFELIHEHRRAGRAIAFTEQVFR